MIYVVPIQVTVIGMFYCTVKQNTNNKKKDLEANLAKYSELFK